MTSKVVVKMDIEGSEVDVIPDLIFNGGLAHTNLLLIEWHPRAERIAERKAAHFKVLYTQLFLSIAFHL